MIQTRRGFLKMLGAALAAPIIEPVARKIIVQVPGNYFGGKQRFLSEVEARLNAAMRTLEDRLAQDMFAPDRLYMHPDTFAKLDACFKEVYSGRNIRNLIYKENVFLKEFEAFQLDTKTGLWG